MNFSLFFKAVICFSVCVFFVVVIFNMTFVFIFCADAECHCQ